MNEMIWIDMVILPGTPSQRIFFDNLPKLRNQNESARARDP